MADGDDKRLVDLEMRLAFQEDMIQTLNDTVVKQQAELERLHAALERLTEHVKRLQPGEGDSASEPPPPHY